MDELFAAFGYTGDPTNVHVVYSLQVDIGTTTETLQPAVVLYVRMAEDAEQIGYAMDPDLAEDIAGKLSRAAEQARATHWE